MINERQRCHSTTASQLMIQPVQTLKQGFSSLRLWPSPTDKIETTAPQQATTGGVDKFVSVSPQDKGKISLYKLSVSFAPSEKYCNIKKLILIDFGSIILPWSQFYKFFLTYISLHLIIFAPLKACRISYEHFLFAMYP